MAEIGLLLLIHGEVTDSSVDIFDREKVFISTILQPIITKFPTLKVVMEHITTADAVEFILSQPSSSNLAATITLIIFFIIAMIFFAVVYVHICIAYQF
jgi:dihydroorotase